MNTKFQYQRLASAPKNKKQKFFHYLLLTTIAIFTSFAHANTQIKYPAPGFYSNEMGSPLFALLQSAQKTIDIEIYTFQDKQVRTLIRSALQRGVAVRIVKEPSPGDCGVFDRDLPPSMDPKSPEAADCLDQRKLVVEVNNAPGSAYIPFNKEAYCTDRCVQHGKLVIIDSKVAMISTGNFDATNLCDSADNPKKCNRDYSIVINHPGYVATYQDVFLHDLTAKPYDLAALLKFHANGGALPITVSPLSMDPILAFVNSAKKSIHIQNQYLNEPNLNQALLKQARNGVQITVNTASACSFGKPTTYDANRIQEVYQAFDLAGIKSRMFTASQSVGGRRGYMHAKAIVVDDSQAWVGSVNGSTQAFLRNREYGIFFNELKVVQSLEAIMGADFAHPKSESWFESLQCKNDMMNLPQLSILSSFYLK